MMKEKININDYPFEIFCWFSPYFDLIFRSEGFGLITTVELDVTFRALKPYVICVPLLKFHNRSIPLGILASVSEKSSLYCLFFEELIKLDSENWK